VHSALRAAHWSREEERKLAQRREDEDVLLLVDPLLHRHDGADGGDEAGTTGCTEATSTSTWTEAQQSAGWH
jgi:hypothetical protein